MRPLLITLILFMQLYACAQEKPADNLMFNCFKNTATDKEEGNCVAIAFIKAAIGTFGVNNVFRAVSRDDNIKAYSIMLRNGEIVSLAYAELDMANKTLALKGKNTDLLSGDICKYATLCYATMAKKLQLSTSNHTFATAIADLSDGYSIGHIATLLGLILKPIKPVNVKELAHYNHIVVKNHYYAAYAYMGYYDEVSEKQGYAPLDAIRKYHAGLPCALKRCNITEAYRVDEL